MHHFDDVLWLAGDPVPAVRAAALGGRGQPERCHRAGRSPAGAATCSEPPKRVSDILNVRSHRAVLPPAVSGPFSSGIWVKPEWGRDASVYRREGEGEGRKGEGRGGRGWEGMEINGMNGRGRGVQ